MSTPPQISTVLPISGDLRGGTQVDISGSGLSNATGVFFGTVAATIFQIESDTLILAISPPGSGAGQVQITVVTPNGNTVASPAAEFSYIPPIPPTVVSVFPALGSVAGGTPITITGAALTGATDVHFGAVPAAQFFVQSDHSILALAPAGVAPGAVPITVSSAGGSSGAAPAAAFTYLASQGTGASTQGGALQGTSSGGGSGSSQGGGASQGASQGSTSQSGSSGSGSPGNGSKAGSTSAGSSGASSSQGSSSQGSSGGNAGQRGSGSPASTQTGGDPSGNYIPGGLGPVPGGYTGLGGTAGTGAGFGVGTLLPGGGGSAPPSNLPYYVDPGLTAQLVQSLMGLVQNAASPDAMEAQNLILRRIALEGDVIGSRMPPPRNISEIGGYLNLLSALKEKEMREQALAGVLGVAGPTRPLGWITNNQPLAMVAITNDRPAVAAQNTVPLTVLIRSDFVAPFQSALKTLHGYGVYLPLTSPSVITLPAGGTGSVVPSSQMILFYLGRAVSIAPSMALVAPGADPVALLGSSSSGPFQLASNVLTPAGALSPPPELLTSASPYAVVCTLTSQSVVILVSSPYIFIAPILASAGFYPVSPIPVPANSTIHSWAWLNNTTGLIAGTTELGDELSLLYRQDQIANSVFASMVSWTWNGKVFSP